jgi:uncharacterized protein (TIGR03086 family)
MPAGRIVSAGNHAEQEGEPVDPVEQLQSVIEEAQHMIGSVRPYERKKQTPCQGWDVSGLIYHMIGTCASFTAALQAASGGGDSTPDLQFDLAASYAEITGAVMKEWRMPGALDRTITIRAGQVPASVGIWILIADQLLHTWDLSKALGRPYTMPEDTATQLLQFMQRMLKPEMRGPGKAFGPEVPCPEDAPVRVRLVAFSGRQP